MTLSARKRPIGLVVGVVLAVAVSSGAALAAVDAGKVIASRIDGFKKMGSAFKGMNDGLKSDAPDAKVLADQAKTVNQVAHQVGKWFPAGSGPESGQKTRAKAEIWSDGAGFATAVKNLEIESAKLETVAKGGDIEALKAQVKATGGACGGCHTKYRAPEQH
jgi:cytochrome c556